MNRKKTLLITILFLVLAATLTGYMLWNKPHKDVKDASALNVQAAELYNYFITDSASAKSKYTDKIVEVTGEVARLAVNQQDQQIILIKTRVPGAFINCTMEEKSGELKEGSTITVKGICSGYIGGDADMGLPGDVFLIRGYTTVK